MKTRWLALILAIISVTSCSAKETKIPPEVGNVNWQQNYAKTLAKAKESKKPIFALFQEVPG